MSRTASALGRGEVALGELRRAGEELLEARDVDEIEPEAQHRPTLARSVARWMLACTLGCGIAADPAIAGELRKRVAKPAPGWASVPCEDRAVKVERLRPIVPLVHDLTGRVRTFATPMVPQLLERLAAHDVLAAVPDYRCVVRDYASFDSRTEPNYLAGQRSFANMLVLEGQRRLAAGDDSGWAHVVGAMELYRDPIGPQLGEHLELATVLSGVRAAVDEHTPPPDVIDTLVEAVDAATMPRATACTSMRHELYVLAVASWRSHLGKPERELFTARFGPDLARQLWSGGKPGTHDRATFDAWLDVHDALAKTCEKQPLSKVVRALAQPTQRLTNLDIQIGTAASGVTEHVKQYNAVLDAQLGMSAALRALAIRAREGRDPTAQELAAAVRVPAPSAWDGALPLYAIDKGTLTVIRGGTRFDFTLPD